MYGSEKFKGLNGGNDGALSVTPMSILLTFGWQLFSAKDSPASVKCY